MNFGSSNPIIINPFIHPFIQGAGLLQRKNVLLVCYTLYHVSQYQWLPMSWIFDSTCQNDPESCSLGFWGPGACLYSLATLPSSIQFTGYVGVFGGAKCRQDLNFAAQMQE